jgi:excisionase family DNA binding protein
MKPTRFSNPPIPFRAAFSVAEFCASFGIGRTLFYRLVAEGQIKVFRLGARTLIPASQVEKFEKGWVA